jgi:biopolymer transport protein ExbD
MKKLHINHHSEMELDLAALLAVMMKLVPVLLLSSAFMQLMVIETDLPQVVTEAIQKQEKENKKNILVEVNPDRKVVITIDNQGQKSTVAVEAKDGHVDLAKLQMTFREIKKQNPDVFKIDLSPSSDVAYNEVVKLMDEARRSRDASIRFPVKDEKTGQDTTTDYMFPEIVFVNMMEG